MFILKDQQAIEGGNSLETMALTYDPKHDLLFYGDNFGILRSLSESLTKIVKENAQGTMNVKYDDSKKLPFFSFQNYKKKATA